DLVNAFVAIEDKTFWTHHGFNVVRIIGAIVNSLKTGDSISGTSTITQQLARNLYLKETMDIHTGLAGYTRKIQEAYYTLILERELSKKQIIEAYLNTIYLGQNSYGIYAASQTYFSKDVHELNLAEIALLASIPKAPKANAPFKTLTNSSVSDPSLYDILYTDTLYTVVYQANYRKRLEQVLYNMEEYGMISHEQREEAKAYDLRAAIKPSREKTVTVSSYFADYVTAQVRADLMDEYNISYDEASKMLRTGGLRVYSTIDTRIQKIADDAFADPANFPTLVNMSKDKEGNIINKDNNVMLYYYDSFFDEEGTFTLKKSEYEVLANGDLKIYRGNRLNIYRVTSNGQTTIQVEFKNLYSDDDETFYQINGGVLNIPSAYMSRDDAGNLILAKNFLADGNYRSLFVRQDDGSYKIKSGLYSLRQKTIQPQAAMVITDYHTGEIKCMVGGRTGEGGKLLYNRALSTRQPGSSIKPFTVYGAALQRSYDLVQSGNPLNEKIFTPATVIDDAPMLNDIGEIWPKNSYNYYRGLNSLRKAVEQSINVCAVKVQTTIGNAASIEYATRFGITSFVTDTTKAANDMNPSALA
ncbi:MAG: transglycosylase domain-containing protein, partial [Firmicutes bacterium]|nr:transglycosylase domain-containing protein [Bacillota bacterium]